MSLTESAQAFIALIEPMNGPGRIDEPVSAIAVTVMVAGLTPTSGEPSAAPVHALGVVLPPAGAVVTFLAPRHAVTTSRIAVAITQVGPTRAA